MSNRYQALRLITRVRWEIYGLAQGIWEIAHALDVVSVSGPPWRWRAVDTGSAERVAAVRAGTRKVGAGGVAAVTWPPPGENWEGGYRDEQGHRRIHTPNEGWREETTPAPFLDKANIWKSPGTSRGLKQR